MKNLLYILLGIAFFSSCQNREEQQLIKQLEKAQLRSNEILGTTNLGRYHKLTAEYLNNPAKCERLYKSADKVHRASEKLLARINSLLKDSTLCPDDLHSVYDAHVDLAKMIKKQPYFNNEVDYEVLSEEVILGNEKYCRIGLMQIYQEVLVHEYSHLTNVLSMIGHSGWPNWYVDIESSYYEYRDSSYINLHIPPLEDVDYYVIIDNIKQNGKVVEVPYLPEKVSIDSRVRLFDLKQGKYEIEGKVRFLSWNEELHDIPFSQKFEKK